MIVRLVVGLTLVAILGIGCSSNGSATGTGEQQEASKDTVTGDEQQFEQQLITSLQRLAGESPTSSPSPTGSPSEPTRQPTPTVIQAVPESGAVSLDDYIDMCSQLNETTIDFDGKITYGEFSSHLGYMVETLDSITPPDEVAGWHVETRAALAALKDVVDSQPSETPVGDEFPDLVARLEPLQERLVTAIEDIPVDIRRQMVDGGCIS